MVWLDVSKNSHSGFFFWIMIIINYYLGVRGFEKKMNYSWNMSSSVGHKQPIQPSNPAVRFVLVASMAWLLHTHPMQDPHDEWHSKCHIFMLVVLVCLFTNPCFIHTILLLQLQHGFKLQFWWIYLRFLLWLITYLFCLFCPEWARTPTPCLWWAGW